MDVVRVVVVFVQIDRPVACLLGTLKLFVKSLDNGILDLSSALSIDWMRDVGVQLYPSLGILMNAVFGEFGPAGTAEF